MYIGDVFLANTTDYLLDLANFGRRDTDSTISIFYRIAQVGQGKLHKVAKASTATLPQEGQGKYSHIAQGGQGSLKLL